MSQQEEAQRRQPRLANLAKNSVCPSPSRSALQETSICVESAWVPSLVRRHCGLSLPRLFGRRFRRLRLRSALHLLRFIADFLDADLCALTQCRVSRPNVDRQNVTVDLARKLCASVLSRTICNFDLPVAGRIKFSQQADAAITHLYVLHVLGKYTCAVDAGSQLWCGAVVRRTRGPL